MVVQTEREDGTWFECESCGLLLDEYDAARTHEANCDEDDEPIYIQ